jgi:hypothetical protein
MEPECSTPLSQKPATGTFPSRLNLGHNLTFLKIHFQIIPSTPWSPKFPSVFPTKILYAFLDSYIPATCPAHLILIALITLTIFSEDCKL